MNTGHRIQDTENRTQDTGHRIPKAVFKILFLSSLFISNSCVVYAGSSRYTAKQLQFINEFGQPVNLTTSASIYIYQAGTTTQLTCYLTADGTKQITQPITPTSTNTPLDYQNGVIKFYSRPQKFKLVVTDGTYTRTKDNLTETDTFIQWLSYPTANDTSDANAVMATHESTYNHSLIATAVQTESDPILALLDINSTDVAHWITAYGWGNHAGLYDLINTAAGLIATLKNTYDMNDIATALQPASIGTTVQPYNADSNAITAADIEKWNVAYTRADPNNFGGDANDALKLVQNTYDMNDIAAALQLATDANERIDALPSYSEATMGGTFKIVGGVWDVNDAAVADGDTGHVPNGNQVYDFVKNITNVKEYIFDVPEPNIQYDSLAYVCIDVNVTAAMHISKLYLSCEFDPNTEPNVSLCYANAWKGRVSETTIKNVTGTAGVINSTISPTVAVAAGKCLYLKIMARPDAYVKQWAIKVCGTYD